MDLVWRLGRGWGKLSRRLGRGVDAEDESGLDAVGAAEAVVKVNILVGSGRELTLRRRLHWCWKGFLVERADLGVTEVGRRPRENEHGRDTCGTMERTRSTHHRDYSTLAPPNCELNGRA